MATTAFSLSKQVILEPEGGGTCLPSPQTNLMTSSKLSQSFILSRLISVIIYGLNDIHYKSPMFDAKFYIYEEPLQVYI